MSVGVMSASQGTYSPTQLQLDISQGARIASSAYPTPVPAPLSLAGEGEPLTGWRAVKARATSAPQELTPGLLSSSIPGGGAYAAPGSPNIVVAAPGKPPHGNAPGGETPAPRADGGGAFAVAADRGGRIASVSIDVAATLTRRIEGLLGTHRLVVADLSGGSAGIRQLAGLLSRRAAGRLVIAVQRVPAGKRGQLLWVGAAGLRGSGPGALRKDLTSQTTQQRGLVSSVDLAPTVLSWLGLPIPSEMRGRSLEADGSLDGADLRAFAARLRVVGPRRLSALAFLLCGWAAVLIATAAFTRARETRARAVRIGAVGVMWAPVAVLLPAALAPSAGIEYALIAVLCLALGALTDFLLPWPRALIAPAVAAPLLIVLDSFAHTQLLVRSVLGPDPILGARFYGVGNELKSGLAVLVLCAVAAALYPSARHSRRQALASVLVAGFALALIEGSARVGAGVGGVILVCAGTAVTAVLLSPDASVRRRALLALLAPVAGLIVLAGLDLATAHGSGHFTGSVLHARSAGDVRDIIVRRYKAAWGELHNHAMPIATVLALVGAALAVRSRERLLAPVGGDQLWLAALSGGPRGRSPRRARRGLRPGAAPRGRVHARLRAQLPVGADGAPHQQRGHHVGERAQRDHGGARGQRRHLVGEHQPAPHRREREPRSERRARPTAGSQPLRGACGSRQQAEQQQRADRLRRLRGDHAEKGHEADREHSRRDTSRPRQLRRHRGEEQRPPDRRHREQDAGRDDRRERSFAGAEPEDRAEQRARRLDARTPPRAQAEARQEEHAEGEHNREQDTDVRIVGRRGAGGARAAGGEGAAPEERDRDAGGDRRCEQADPLVDPGRGGRQRTRERDVAERVTSEELPSQDDEPAAHSAGERDEAAGEQRVTHVFLAQHQAPAPVRPPSPGTACSRRREPLRRSSTAIRASR